MRHMSCVNESSLKASESYEAHLTFSGGNRNEGMGTGRTYGQKCNEELAQIDGAMLYVEQRRIHAVTHYTCGVLGRR